MKNNTSNSLKEHHDERMGVLNIQEKERQRISRELHDSSVQNLTHLIHMIELSSMYIDQDTTRAKLELESCIQILKSTINGMREIIFNLRPMSFDDLGFKHCIENFITECKMQYKDCRIVYDVCELCDCEHYNIDNQYNIFLMTIYRIIHEAMINALKHSNADKVILTVKKNDQFCFICINDNGKGFSLEDIEKKKKKHFGLSIMEERVSLLHGKFLMDAVPDKGTKIEIEIPITPKKTD